MGLRRLPKSQQLEALHQAFLDEVGTETQIPPKVVKRVLYRGLGLISTQSWQATMEALDELGLMNWVRGEGLTVLPSLHESPIEDAPLHA